MEIKNDQIVEVPMNLTINEEKIRMINIRNSVNKLGVHISPSLRWIDEHEHVEQKIKNSIKKLITLDMKLHQACLYFNIFMLTNVFLDVELLSLLKKMW